MAGLSGDDALNLAKSYVRKTLDGAGALKGEKGDPGTPGRDGQDGADGKSAYDIWLEQGNVGTEQEFLDSLKGDGSSIVVDDKIDTSSTNPVQNKVLAQEIARAETGKQYLKITGPMPSDIDYLYARTIRDAIENGNKSSGFVKIYYVD